MFWIWLLIALTVTYVIVHKLAYEPWREKMMRRKILNILAGGEHNEGRLIQRVRSLWRVPEVVRLLREMEVEKLIKSEFSPGGRMPRICSITDQGLRQVKRLPLAK
jgi:DNA-binding PadR family transcriptional regulator